jgi:hypothetical protein
MGKFILLRALIKLVNSLFENEHVSSKGSNSVMNSKFSFLSMVSLFAILYLIGQPTFSTTQNPSVKFMSSNLPIIIINTSGQSIPDDVRIGADMKIIDNGKGKRNYIDDLPNNYDGKIAIELRGSATLEYPKKSYRFETQDYFGNNRNVELCGLPRENDWILYGPYDDQSLIRNVLAYRLSNDIGRYASRVRMCELVLDEDYRGVYILMEKIKRDNDRVDISEMAPTATTGDAVTGGYILKIDKWSGENVDGWRSARRVDYQYHYPKPDEIVAEQKTYIQNFINRFESAMNRSNIADPSFGYPAYIDVDSFVDHFLLNELGKNIDAYRISFYFSKDRDSKSGKLNAGPIWDFNLSFGKTWYPEDAFRVDEWEIDHNEYKPFDSPKVPFWWENLGHERHFAWRVKQRWDALRKDIFQTDSLFRRIDLLVDTLAEARARNFQRWPETASEHSYEEEIQMMKDWIVGRIAWIEENIGEIAAVSNHSALKTIHLDFQLKHNYPNPFNQATMIEYYLPQTENVRLIIYDLMGRRVKTLIDDQQPQGHFQTVWNGTSERNLPVATGVYLCRLEVGSAIKVIKLVLVK